MADPTSLKIGKATTANTYLAIWMAEAAGFYAAHGLDLGTVEMVGGSDSGPAFAEGRIQFMHIGMSSVVRANAAGADLVIYDSTYTDEEYPAYAGWGHSTWQEGVRLCDAAGVGTLVLFHHDPSHDDAVMDEIAAAAEAARPGTLVAREGCVLTP